MTTHNMRLKEKSFNLIKEHKKTIELRLYDEKRAKIAIGDTIVFSNGENQVSALVVGLAIAETFNDLFKSVAVEKTGFSTKEEAISVMEQFYPLEEQQKNRVIGIAIQVLKDND